MAVPNNTLQTVQTYQKAELAWLLNSFCGIKLANKKFQKFNDLTANLGDTVNFDLPPRYVGYNGLVITQQQSKQRVQSLVCSQATNVSSGYTDQQFIFNVRDYMDRFGEAAMKELGSVIEADIWKNIVTGVQINDPQNANFGARQTDSGPYRFYGDGVTAINSYGQLAQAVANFNDFGAAKNKLRGVLPETVIPGIITTGLQQFVPGRNEKDAMSWELGKFAGADWYQSNLLPIHTAGSLGEDGTVLTVVSINADGTQITVSGAGTGTVVVGDMGQFQDGVAGQNNVRFRHFIGHSISSLPVQFVVKADATAAAGSVVLDVNPPLISAAGPDQNISVPIVAGMKIKLLPSHRAGVLYSGDQFYMAMPQLPDQSPFTTVNTMDKDSGASIRHYFGSQFGQNNRAYVRDSIWGSTMVPANTLRLVFPL
jgi:hypothetical protein